MKRYALTLVAATAFILFGLHIHERRALTGKDLPSQPSSLAIIK